MITFQKLFNDIKTWQDKTFGNYDNPFPSYRHMEKEFKELEDALIKGSPDDTNEEFADNFMLLIGMYIRQKRAEGKSCTYYDLLHAINGKFKINKNRNWSEPDEDGVMYHIKESC